MIFILLNNTTKDGTPNLLDTIEEKTHFEKINGDLKIGDLALDFQKKMEPKIPVLIDQIKITQKLREEYYITLIQVLKMDQNMKIILMIKRIVKIKQ